MKKTYIISAIALGMSYLLTTAQEIHYSGSTLSNPYLLDGGLSPAIGVHNIQTMRAARTRLDICNGWTYNHQPMIAYWQGRFWMHFLSDPVGEHIPSSATWLQSSVDGYQWSTPEILFPEYEIPADILSRARIIYNEDGSLHKISDTLTYRDMYPRENLKAIMHQRVGWYVSSAETGSKLLAIGNYGICLHKKDDPNDGNGIGRVVREVMPDGTFGPVYFFYYNHGWNASNTIFPNYSRSKDKKFRKAVEEILASPLYWMQFVEECDREDPHLPVKNGYKAFNYYTLPDGKTMVSLWKHALTSFSTDGGVTWDSLVHRAPGFVNSNAKIWGQRLSDGMYATVYNPSEFRWPLAISLSADGLDYKTLNLVHGDITEMRYGGNYKSNGPQYVRGILPGNGLPKDSDLWIAYSVNKEDMWVGHIPVPVRTQATSHAVADEIAQATALADLREWNLYSPLMAPISLKDRQLVLADRDPFDYAKADRMFPAVRHLKSSFDIVPSQNDKGSLEMEFCDATGNPCSRLCWQSDGQLTVKTGARYTTVMRYLPNEKYHVSADVNLDTRMIEVEVVTKDAEGNPYGKNYKKRAILFAPIAKIERITLRTGARRTDLTPDTKADRAEYEDLKDADKVDPEASWSISQVETAGASTALLQWRDFSHYVDEFNAMEDENIAQHIPNSEAEQWMSREIPLFECPDAGMQEMYYYRWWTLRKHIIKADSGFAQTEFLVKRSYSDKHNLIACAVSHHIMESRWLHNPLYATDEARVWLRDNQGSPLAKLHKFSSLIPYALLQDAKVTGSTAALLDLRQDIKADMEWWDENHLWCNATPQYGKDEGEQKSRQQGFAPADSLYWQGDVQDGMEESISGGRYSEKKRMFHQNRRPTINSYMYGNFAALSEAYQGTQWSEYSRYCADRAATLKELTQQRLWDADLSFFCARDKFDSLCQVRELVGYLPWYTGLADDDPKYAEAWHQLSDDQGFLAPFGMTTAEQRHPRFRKAWTGRPTCEWDGAIWPFATSQTLTALANLMNDYPLTAALLPDSLFFTHLKLYTESMHRRGHPYIGEYLDEKNGNWLWGDAERSRYYNHSTYNDLIISGLVGLRPALPPAHGKEGKDVVTVHPLLPSGSWSYFCLDDVHYHGHILTIIWDADGMRYGQGAGLTLLVDGRRAASRPDLGILSTSL